MCAVCTWLLDTVILLKQQNTFQNVRRLHVILAITKKKMFLNVCRLHVAAGIPKAARIYKRD